ncbi:hypothetical protein N9L27_06890, partial [Candidatus Poseidoniales archaeon]|nr:hypothetical protein [Candidatus Poseidoniales archaeon]
MRRRKKGKRDEAQASLDAFTQPATPPTAPSQPLEPSSPSVPSMPDLDVLAKADEMIRREDEAAKAGVEVDASLRSFEMPSMQQQAATAPPTSTAKFHDLGKRYPYPPIPVEGGGLVLHRAVLNDLTGCAPLLDWV